MADNETIADIIAEMRGFKRYAASDSNDCRYVAYWLYQTFADRLEAAHKRERGDCAKLREALKAIGGLCAGLMPTWDGAIGRIKDIAEAALSAPPRNCDVYTSDELKVIFNSELASELPIANEHEKNLVAITAMGVIDTLLAPATEKEGGGR